MQIEEVLSKVDHTLLGVDADWAQIARIIDDGIRYHTASVCIPPSFVKRAREYAAGKVAICTVIGFPNGYNTTETKVFETQNAIQNGADEIDMVINIGDLKDKAYDRVEQEIRAIKKACGGHILKVIIETCLLSEAEKIKMCEIITRAGGDFIKTSTGFSKAGATREDVQLFRKHIGKGVKMKAAGGIQSIADAEDFIVLGCERLGTSRVVKAVKAMEEGKPAQPDGSY